jgi:hypothetical protein
MKPRNEALMEQGNAPMKQAPMIAQNLRMKKNQNS